MEVFGKKIILLAFLNDSTLKLARYELGSDALGRLDSFEVDFTDIIVKDSIINDAGGFYKKVKEFLETKPEWKGSGVLLVMPEEKVFLKGFELELGDLERKQEIIEGFINEVPYSREDLIVRDRLVGRVMELSAVYKKFVEDLEKPFIDSKFAIAGVISVPQALAIELRPKEKNLILAFYDNDLALVLGENASVMFSETERMGKDKVKEAMAAFSHFVKHMQLENTKAISLIVGEDEVEEEVKNELENKGYIVKEVRREQILDFIAGYYRENFENGKDWNLLFSPQKNFFKKLIKNNYFVYFLAILGTAALISAGWLLYFNYFLISKEMPPIVVPEEPEIPEMATTTEELLAEESEPLTPLNKADFAIDIFNGTFVAGEASRLGDVLEGAGFSVDGIGNYDNQTETRTTLVVGEEVPDSITGEILEILEGIYQEAVISVSPVLGQDINIIIGAKK